MTIERKTHRESKYRETAIRNSVANGYEMNIYKNEADK